MSEEKERPGEETAAAAQPLSKPATGPGPVKEIDDEELDEDLEEELDEETNLDDVADLADEPIEVMEYTIKTTDPADVIESDPKDLRRTNALPASAWIRTPAEVSIPIEGIKVLLRVARKRNWFGNKVPHVRLALLKSEHLLLVAPVHETDPRAVETSRRGKGPLRFNALKVLQPANMTITKGYRELFRVGMTTESPIGPALVIDLNRSLKSRKIKVSAKKKAKTDPSKGQNDSQKT